MMKYSTEQVIKIIIQLQKDEVDAYIDDKHDLGRMKSWWLLKAYTLLFTLDPTSYENAKIEYNNTLHNYLSSSIINTFDQLRIDKSKHLNLEIISEQLLSRIYCYTIGLDKKLNQDTDEYLQHFFDSNIKEKADIYILGKNYELSISIINHLEGYDTSYFLFQRSMTYFLISIIKTMIYQIELYEMTKKESFLQYFLIDEPDEKFVKMKMDVIEALNKGLYYYPMNSLLHKMMSIICAPPDSIKFQDLFYDLGEFGFISKGARFNEQHEYDEAEKIYLSGLNNLPHGIRFGVLYNRSINHQDYAFNQRSKINAKNLANNHNKSITYSKKGIVDWKLSLYIYLLCDSFPKLIYPFIEYPSEIPGNEIHFRAYQLVRFRNEFNITKVPNECISFFTQIYNLIALSYKELGEDSKALSYYQKGIDEILRNEQLIQDPNSKGYVYKALGDLFNNRGLLFMKKMKDYENALYDFHSALSHNAQNKEGVMLNIMACYLHLKDYNSLFSFSERCIQESKSDKFIANALFNQILGHYVVSDPIKMMKNIARYECYKDNDNELKVIAGKYFLRSKMHDEARQYLENAAKEKYIPAFYYLSSLYQKMKRKEVIEKYVLYSKKHIHNQCSHRNIAEMPIFYKFTPIKKHTLQAFIDKYIYFADIFKLNDPFDCRLIQEYSNDTDFRESFDKNGSPRILSLSRLQNDGLLWSHYADQHYGIAVGYKFDNKALIDEKIYVYDVQYVDELESKNNILKVRNSEEKTHETSEDTTLITDIITKHKCWEYENEVRLFTFGKEKVSNKDNLYHISSITFGCLTPEDDIRSIINIFHNKDFEVKGNSIFFDNEEIIEFCKMKKSEKNMFELDSDESFCIQDFI